jgi:hypothetical protein
MAERVGFEPTSPVLPGYPLSRRALSTAQTPLHACSLMDSAVFGNRRELSCATLTERDSAGDIFCRCVWRSPFRRQKACPSSSSSTSSWCRRRTLPYAQFGGLDCDARYRAHPFDAKYVAIATQSQGPPQDTPPKRCSGYVARAKYLKGFQTRIAPADRDDFEGAVCWFSWCDSEPPPRGSRSVPLRDGS